VNDQELAALSHAELLGMCKLLLHNVRAVDGYWFYAVEDHFGRDAAVQLDEEVWDRLGGSEARKIVRQYNLAGDGLTTVLQALERCPSFRCFVEYDAVVENGSRAVLRVSNCLSQEARIRQGRGVFNCAGVEQRYFTSFAQAIAPNVKVRRGFSPPDERRDGLWCEWHFEVDGASS
jgi:hypothetical protein